MVKTAVFLMALLGGAPTLGVLAANSYRIRTLLLVGLVLANCVAIDINLISDEAYRGTTRGTEIGLVDILALGLALGLAMKPGRTAARGLPAGILWFLVYTAFGLPGLVTAEMPSYVFFELMKLSRGLLLFILIYRAIEDEEQLEQLLRAMIIVLLIQTFVFLKQRYVAHIHRVAGTFDHANVLAMYLYVHAAMVWAYLLGGQKAPRVRALIGLGGAALGVIMALSRGALTLFPLALVVGLGLSLRASLFNGGGGFRLDMSRLRRIISVALVAMVGGAVALAIAFDTLHKRFSKGNERGTLGRLEKNAVAFAMARDHRLGVGLNNFSHMTLLGYRYRQMYTIGQESYEQREALGLKTYHAPVHNLFLLVASETGWASLPPFLIAQLRLLQLALRLARRGRTALRQAIGCGAAAMNLSVFAHGILEYQLRVTNIWFAYVTVAAMVAAASRLDRAEKRAPRGALPTPNPAWRVR